MKNTYRFADVRVQIACVNPAVHSFCSSYAAEGPADLSVTTTQADIDRERSHAEYPGSSDLSLETLAVYRKIAEKMPEHDTILFHSLFSERSP